MVTSERSGRLDNRSGMARIIPAAYWLCALGIRSWLQFAQCMFNMIDSTTVPQCLQYKTGQYAHR